MKWCAEDLRCGMLFQLSVASFAAQVKGKACSHTASPTLSLFQIGLASPDSSVICHIVMRREKLHLDLAGIDDKDDIIDGDTCFGNVGGKDDFGHIFRHWLKDPPLILSWNGRVKRKDPISGAAKLRTLF